jgi:hypothetical protein
MYSVAELIGEEQVWPCEFCNHRNIISVEAEEKPKEEAVSYILEAAPVKEESKTGKEDDISIVFCIDISGSMDASKRHGTLTRL